jgi:uncharacterized protein (DUF2141 family)
MQFLDLAAIAAIAALCAAGTASARPAATVEVAAPAIAAEPTGTLALSFTGLEAKEGKIMLALYDEAGWAGGRPVRSAMADAASGEVKVSIEGLPAGRYGVKAFHDVNGNGRMDTNPFGMPTEPFAFSNDAHGQMGPAAWADAAFTLRAGANAQSVTIR